MKVLEENCRNMWSFILISLLSSSVMAKDKYPTLYNGQSKVVLGVAKPMKVVIVENHQVKSTFELPDNQTTKVTGTSEMIKDTKNQRFILDMSFNGPISGVNSTGQLTKADLKFEIIYNATLQYWILTSINVSYTGTDIDITESLDVYNVSTRGYTKKSLDDLSCQRGFATCAPKDLCWSCSDQNITAGSKIKEGPTSQLILTDFKLQPLFANGSFIRFSENWDCDPLIPVSVWTGIFLTLILVSFLYYAIDMVTSLQTPTKFDDAKSKPISVPTGE